MRSAIRLRAARNSHQSVQEHLCIAAHPMSTGKLNHKISSGSELTLLNELLEYLFPQFHYFIVNCRTV
jgi:hypothetical protein